MLRHRAVAAVLLTGAALVVTAAGAPAASAPHCSNSNLRLSFVRATAATSHRFWDLALRNVGTSTCRLRSYPRVALLDNQGNPLSAKVDRALGRPIHLVLLKPRTRAFFTFTYVVSGPCLPNFFSAYGLAVTPPGLHAKLILRRPRFDVCDASVGGDPEVSAVRRTLSGP